MIFCCLVLVSELKSGTRQIFGEARRRHVHVHGILAILDSSCPSFSLSFSFSLSLSLSLCQSCIIRFSLNILRTNRQNETKFCINIFIDDYNAPFSAELRPLIWVRIWFLLHILIKKRQIETKFPTCNIYVGIVKHHFSRICNRVTGP